MVIRYGRRVLFKREGAVGTGICNNCGHNAGHTLCRQVNQVTIFWIPIISRQKQRGIMCESCGNIVPISKKEYKDTRKAIQIKGAAK